jgi:xanthine/uracil permease
MLLPSTTFSTIPDIVRSLVQNGLVMGILVAMILQFAIPWKRFENPS